MAHITTILLVWVLFLCSTKSKKRKSVVISGPIPCNTAFPSSSAPSDPHKLSSSHEPNVTMDVASVDTVGHRDSASDLESVSLTDSDTPSTHRLSMSSEGEVARMLTSANENGHQTTEAQSEAGSCMKQWSMDVSDTQADREESEAPKSPGTEKPKRPPLPTPRLSLTPSESTAPPETPAANSGNNNNKEEGEGGEQQQQQPDMDVTEPTAAAETE